MATHGQTVSLKQTVFDILTENPNLTIRQVIDTLPNQNVNSIKYYYYDFQTRKLKPKKPYKYKQIVKVCPECGKKFHPARKTHQIYCSKKCTYKHSRKNPSLRTCPRCHKKVTSLNIKGICSECEFECGNVYVLINDKWVRKKTDPEYPTKQTTNKKYNTMNQPTLNIP